MIRPTFFFILFFYILFFDFFYEIVKKSMKNESLGVLLIQNWAPSPSPCMPKSEEAYKSHSGKGLYRGCWEFSFSCRHVDSENNKQYL